MKQMGFAELPFVGRQNELKVLTDRLNSAFSNRGSCVIITGESGMGKSRLVREFTSQHKTGTLVLQVSIAPGVTRSHEIASEIVKAYLRSTAPAARVVTKIIDEEMYREFKPSIPELGLHYPYEAEAPGIAGERADVREVIFRFINNLVVLSPVILIIEDIDGMPDDSFGLLEYLLSSITAIPLFVVLTANQQPAVFQRFARTAVEAMETLSLERLNEGELSQLNQLLFNNSFDSDFIIWLSRKTRGVPLFLREFLLALLERGVVFYDSGVNQWRAIGSYAQVSIPERISDMIRLRLKRLSVNELEMLESSAVLGAEFDPLMIKCQNRNELLASLMRAGFLRKNSGNHCFAHTLMRDMLYDNIPAERKARLHREFAVVFESREQFELAADHFLAAGAKSKKVQNLVIKAALESREQGNYKRSIEYCDKAIGLGQDLETGDSGPPIGMYFELCTSLFLGEKYERVFELSRSIDRCLARKRAGHDACTIANYYNQVVQSLLHLGEYQKALKAARKALSTRDMKRLSKCGETIIEIATYQAFIYKNLGNVKKAMDLGVKLQKTYGETASQLNRYNIYKLLGSIANEQQDFKRATEFRGLALECARETGTGHLIAAAQGNLGVSLTTAGQLQRGMELMRSYQDFNVKAGRVRAEIVSYIHMAQIFFNQGFLTQAEAEYLKGIKRCDKQGDHFREVLYELHYRYGTFLVVAEKYAEARKYLESAVRIAREMKAFRFALFPLLNLGCLHIALRKSGELDEVMREIRASYKDEYRTDTTFAVLEGFQSIFHGHVNQGLQQLEGAIKVLEQKQTPAGLFRLLYLCMKYLGSSKNTLKAAEIYNQKAQAVASKYELSGWLQKLVPERANSVVEQLRIHCFGRLWIEHPQKGAIDIAEFERVKPAQLFSILINGMLTRTYYTRERIGTLLWPEFSAAKMTNNFHVCLSQLKDKIGTDYISYLHGNYMLANVWLDVLEFRTLINKGEVLLREGKIHMAELKFEEAVDLYKGDFLEDMPDPWTDAVRDELAALYDHVQLMLGEIYIKKLKFEKAVRIGRTILSNNAYNEEGHRFLIKSYALNGEKAMAVSQYKKCVELFRRELDCEPSEETRELHRKILK